MILDEQPSAIKLSLTVICIFSFNHRHQLGFRNSNEQKNQQNINKTTNENYIIN